MDIKVSSLFKQLSELRSDMLSLASRQSSPSHLPDLKHENSAHNLLHYIAMRRHDLRPLQHELAMLGLSSLGRAECHALASVEAVIRALGRLSRTDALLPAGGEQMLEFGEGLRLLRDHTEDLLGPEPPRRGVRIMVTLATEAADDYTLILSLLRQGMDVVRINCAHDGPEEWLRMIQHVRRAEQTLGRTCRVLMDLGGPKIRTGPIEPGPAVQKWRPLRNSLGRVLGPARIWLFSSEHDAAPPTEYDARVPVPEEWLRQLSIGDIIRFTDTREASRTLRIVDATLDGCWAESTATSYIAPGTTLHRVLQADGSPSELSTTVCEFPAKENPIHLQIGDLLLLTRDLIPGGSATTDSIGRVLSPARIGCTAPEIFSDVRSGERVWLDDGKIGGVVDKVLPDHLVIRITNARVAGEKLRSDKGINLPDSALRLPALTGKDIEDLAFVAEHADIVGLSFAQASADVEMLQNQIKRLGRDDLGIVLKIETRRGFEQLPSMLLTAMKSPRFGVMIARGDLAVESGFERMAEVQEEILWLCEAAHCPVIWATQVLETLAKEGMPSRAEITDAAMGTRAECVMLNKGPHILRAVEMLDDILQRMQAHQSKKQSMLRELRLAQAFTV